jgi:uncharacterized protein YkwD
MKVKRIAIALFSTLAASTLAVGISALDAHPVHAAGRAYVEKCGAGQIFLNEQEKSVLDLHNQARAEHGLRAQCAHPNLEEAVRAHSQEMLDKDYAAHESYSGETVKHRLMRFGYSFSDYSCYAYGENIA